MLYSDLCVTVAAGNALAQNNASDSPANCEKLSKTCQQVADAQKRLVKIVAKNKKDMRDTVRAITEVLEELKTLHILCSAQAAHIDMLEKKAQGDEKKLHECSEVLERFLPHVHQIDTKITELETEIETLKKKLIGVNPSDMRTTTAAPNSSDFQTGKATINASYLAAAVPWKDRRICNY
jgi:chromosome segregation ATPase